MAYRQSKGGSHDERFSFVREYFNTEPRKLAKLVALVLGAFLVVTLLYVGLVGYDKWSTSMNEASHMVWASYTPAAAQVPLSTPTREPGASTLAPRVDGLVPLIGSRSAGRQYVCRTCGRAGLSTWSVTGQPHCPRCGGLMDLSRVQVRDGLSTGPTSVQFP